METMMHVGPKMDKESAEALTLLIERVFKSGRENGIDQETIRKALDMVRLNGEMGSTSVMNCTFDNKADYKSCDS